MFHPEGGRMTNCIAQTSKGTAMGTFVLGGSIGFMLGAVLIAMIVPMLGLRGLLLFIIPGLIVVTLLVYNRKTLRAFSDVEYKKRTDEFAEKRENNWKGFFLLSVIILLESVANYGLMTFIPLFWVNVIGQSETVSGIALGIMLGIGAFSTYLGGKLSDRFSFRRMIIVGSFLYAPSILFAALCTTVTTASIAILLMGLTLNIIRSPAVALGQKYLPNNVGMATGITLGLAVSFGGLASPILGAIGDRHGLVAVILVLAALAGLIALLSLLIKKEN
jgi:FSR family fosmidomycin resistance protein-like MFS transporter